MEGNGLAARLVAAGVGRNARQELVLRPVEGRFGGLAWRVNEGATYSTDVLAARCNTLLEQWIKADETEPEPE